MGLKVDKKIALIKKRLSNKSFLGGWDSQKKMAVIPINSITEKAFIAPKDARQASVAIILFEEKDKLCFFLTKRTTEVEHHKGQISLPGGAIDNHETAVDASLRESNEEIGVDVASFELLGKLSNFYTPVSYFNIHPFIWFAGGKPKININLQEVDEVYSISINELTNEKNISSKNIQKSGVNFIVPSFRFSSCVCWGATAMILSEFKDLILDL
tara:strand:+ start:1732 stop:2373 length:642 start_codon:yes stop_codon:yes gene_type:complete